MSSGRARRKRSEKNASSCAASLSTASASEVRAGGDLADLVAQDLRVEELLRILPLVERLGLVEPLVALQANELGRERRGQRLGELGLADAGRPLDEDRLLHAVGEVDRGGDAAVAHVVVGAQARDDVVDAGEGGHHQPQPSTVNASRGGAA